MQKFMAVERLKVWYLESRNVPELFFFNFGVGDSIGSAK